MSATLVVRHSVADYAAWRTVYDELATLRAQHGCTDPRVFSAPGDANDLFVTHDSARSQTRRASRRHRS